MKVTIDSLLGKSFHLYGVCDNTVKLGNSNGEVVHLRAVEDPNDGYRSSLDYYEIVDGKDYIFLSSPVATVTVNGNPDEVVEFTDKDNHVWLTVGTKNYDDYYPYFVFSWTPPKIPTSLDMFSQYPVS